MLVRRGINFMRIKGLFAVLLAVTLVLSPAISLGKSKSKAKAKKNPYCDIPGYICLKVRGGQTWASLFPDERERGIVMRINHRNGGLYSGIVLKVPQDLTYGDLLDYSPFPTTIEAPNEKLVIFDPKLYAWGAYDADGQLVRWGPATGGQRWCQDIDQPCRTKAGEFRIYSLGSSNCVSTKFPIPDGGAPMPYCMFFNGGQALHGSPGGVIKDNVSHGCVRMFVEDAEWMRYDFAEGPEPYNEYRGTKVVVMPYTDSQASDEEDAHRVAKKSRRYMSEEDDDNDDAISPAPDLFQGAGEY